ncbi:NAD-dependent epimerase/dehydratase family protein [Caldisphaera sp.]|uniref:NAD-dependent epimerase/dehydratase family protein n=1 Tax=Caldisphaera sp. TaxID=2060322 RepID=UPI0025BE54AA|nr:NAD-dependent epimerase/dehydratase family protein [Caldisphaera sp.]
MIIVTGGAGFIGSNLIEDILKDDNDAIIIDNLSSGSRYNINGRAKLIISDVSKYKEIEFLEKFKGEEVSIIHLAAIVSVDEVRENPIRGIEVNVNGTSNVLELARKLDAYITIASSAAVYGEKEKMPIDEDDEKKPINLYGFTKLMGEEMLLSYIKEYGLKGSALRLFNVYGPKMKKGPYAGVIQIFIEKLLKNETPIIHGDGKNTRDFIYVKDVTNAFINAIKFKASGIYNIGTGKEITIKELLDVIEKIIGKYKEPIYDEPRKNDIKKSVAKIEKAKKELNWEPVYSLEEGLKKTINYIYSKI